MRKSLFRLMIFNIVLIALTTLVPIVVYLGIFQDLIHKQVDQVNAQMVGEFQNVVERSITEQVIQLSAMRFGEFSNHDALLYPFRHDISKNSSRILAAAHQLREFESAYPFLESVDVYYIRSNLLFTGPNVCFLDQGDCERIEKNRWLIQFAEQEAHTAWTNLDSQDGSAVTYVRSYPFFAHANQRQGVIAFHLDTAYITELIESLAFSQERQLWIVDENGEVIAANAEGQAFERKKDILKQIMNDRELTGRIHANIQGEPYVISYRAASSNPWYYISAVSLRSYLKQSGELRYGLYVTGVLLLLTNLFIGFFILRRSHRSIQARWERNEPLIRQNYVDRVLHGHALPDAHGKASDEMLQIRFEAPSCFSFQIRFTPSGSESKGEAVLLPYQLKELLDSSVTSGELHTIVKEEQLLIGMVHFDGEEEAPILSEMAAALDQLAAVRTYRIAAGSVYPCTPEHCALSYQEAAAAMGYVFLLDSPILRYRELRLEERMDKGSHDRVLLHVEDASRSGDTDRLKNLLEGLCSELQNGFYTLSYCKHVLREVLSSVRKGWKAAGFVPEQLLGYDLRSRGTEIETLQEFRVWMGTLIDEAAAKAAERNETEPDQLEAKILSYIQEHLFADISLDALADHVGFSPNYVSKMFRTMTGTTFTDYVTDLKMQQACLLLQEGELNVQDIAVQLGYASTSHFINVFKRKIGCTPKQYQKQQRLDHIS